MGQKFEGKAVKEDFDLSKIFGLDRIEALAVIDGNVFIFAGESEYHEEEPDPTGDTVGFVTNINDMEGRCEYHAGHEGVNRNGCIFTGLTTVKGMMVIYLS
jgi:hypothetical protein